MATNPEKGSTASAMLAKHLETFREGEGTTRLVSPACEKGCDPCFRECALARITAIALQAVIDQQAPAFTHNGVSYTGTAGRA